MANDILAATSDPHNAENSTIYLFYKDTARLADLFKLSYECYYEKPILEVEGFANLINLLVEYIHAICQQDPQNQAYYQSCRDQFQLYDNDDFVKQMMSCLKPLTLCLANLVQCAIESFRVLNYPKGYVPFIDLLENLFTNDAVITAGKYREVYLLIEQLRQKPS